MSLEAALKIRYDADANAAYIYFAAEGTLAGNIAKTYLCDTREINGMINLDFDGDGRTHQDPSARIPVDASKFRSCFDHREMGPDLDNRCL